MQYCLNYIWYKVFVHLKLKLLNFLTDSVLIFLQPWSRYIKHAQG